MNQKTIKLILRIVSGFLAVLMIGSLFTLTGCSSQGKSSSSIDLEAYEPTWDESKLTERDLTVEVEEGTEGDYYMVTVDWQNPDTLPGVTLESPSGQTYEPRILKGSSATFTVSDFEIGLYTVHISGYGLGQISIMSYPYTGSIQALEVDTADETETMQKIRDIYQSYVSTDLQAKLTLIPTNKVPESGNFVGYSADSEGYYCFNPEESFAFMILDAKSEGQADDIAMSVMDYVQSVMYEQEETNYKPQCWAVGTYAAFLLTPSDYDYELIYTAMNQFMSDSTAQTQETPNQSEPTYQSEQTQETPNQSEPTDQSEQTQETPNQSEPTDQSEQTESEASSQSE